MSTIYTRRITVLDPNLIFRAKAHMLLLASAIRDYATASMLHRGLLTLRSIAALSLSMPHRVLATAMMLDPMPFVNR